MLLEPPVGFEPTTPALQERLGGGALIWGWGRWVEAGALPCGSPLFPAAPRPIWRGCGTRSANRAARDFKKAVRVR